LIKGSEGAYFSLESKNIGIRGIGWWRHIINQKTYPHHEPIGPKPPIQIKQKFFILSYTTPPIITGFEQLFSSVCCWVMAGQSLPWKGKLCLFCKVLN